MKLKQITAAALALVLLTVLSACGTAPVPQGGIPAPDVQTEDVPADADTSPAPDDGAPRKEEEAGEMDGPEEAETGKTLRLYIDGKEIAVDWEDNESAEALATLAASGPLTVQMSMYGGFEQVGPLGSRLPDSDERITAATGDIVLYSGSRIVIFYGSNTWEYTRLGKIAGMTDEEIAGLLGNGDVTVTIAYE